MIIYQVVSIFTTLAFIYVTIEHISLYSKYEKLTADYERVLKGYTDAIIRLNSLDKNSSNKPKENTIQRFSRPLKWPYKPSKGYSD